MLNIPLEAKVKVQIKPAHTQVYLLCAHGSGKENTITSVCVRQTCVH